MSCRSRIAVFADIEVFEELLMTDVARRQAPRATWDNWSRIRARVGYAEQHYALGERPRAARGCSAGLVPVFISTAVWVSLEQIAVQLRHVVYQSEGWFGHDSNASRHRECAGESSSAAYTKTLVSTTHIIGLPWLDIGTLDPRYLPGNRP